ncbi:MAG: Outer membrane protein Omp38 precursor [Syntrophus sp. PtaB.Bin001]|nr:MAG: Outer membrane protein Omp38 precursor [Syntrophus sp. PtaB.Bin001]
MKRIFSIFVPLALFALIMGCASAPVVKPVDLNPKLTSGQYVQKTDAFEVIFDSTLSMNDPNKKGTKLDQQKALVNLFNDTIPNLKLNEAIRTFGRFSIFGDPTTKLLYGPASYSKTALPNAINPITRGEGFSPLDVALDGAKDDLKAQSGQLAVIAFSDGEDMEKYDPVGAAKRLKDAYGDRICVYTVHLGSSPVGAKVMQQVADTCGCGFAVEGESISSPQAMADFVEKIFLAPAPVVKEEPKPVVEEAKPVVEEAKVEPKVEPKGEEPVFITLNIMFATGKADIQPKYKAEIKKVADYMKKHPEATAVIEGHTDNVASRAQNMKLSEARANSVKNYLVKNFKIDASRLEAVGYGPDKPIASNATKEGRQKNRRVTAVFSNVKQ